MDVTNIFNLHNLIISHPHFTVSKPAHEGEEVALPEFIRLVVLHFVQQFLGCGRESIVFVIGLDPLFFLNAIHLQVSLLRQGIQSGRVGRIQYRLGFHRPRLLHLHMLFHCYRHIALRFRQQVLPRLLECPLECLVIEIHLHALFSLSLYCRRHL